MASILNVDKIRATGSTTDAVTVDSSGRVLKPNQICFSAYHSGNIAYGSATNTFITHNTTRFNEGGHYDTSTGRFTVPAGCGGKYLVTFADMYMDETSFFFIFLGIAVNGTVKQEFMATGRDNYSTVNGSMLFDLSAGDYLQMYSGMNTVDAGYWRGGETFNHFDAYYLG